MRMFDISSNNIHHFLIPFRQSNATHRTAHMQTNVGKSNARAMTTQTMMATDAEQEEEEEELVEEENAEHNQILLALHFNFAKRIDANDSRALHISYATGNWQSQ